MTAPSLGAYARSLARPVARGLLALPHAQAGLRALAYRRARDGTLEGDGDPEGAFAFANWLLDRHLQDERTQRGLVENRIDFALRTKIRLLRKSSALRAEAHDVNAALGFPLSEQEVDDRVAELMSAFLDRRGRAYG
jgi:hypothetical protein